jgi:tetratricopeptide (TPR) repeat protein
MKKLILLVFMLCLSGAQVQAQDIQVQNMVNYLRNKDYAKAKNAADLASAHESTKGKAKTWMYRGNVYKAIYDTSARDQLDSEAEEKALEAYVNCLKLDEKEVYKDDVKGNLVRAAAATRNKANYYKFNKQYDKALRCFELLEQALPYDFDGGIKRNNITKEKLVFDRYELHRAAGDNVKTKEFADKLIGMNYKDPKIFVEMTRHSLAAKDTAMALSYIEKGRSMFEDNMDLITYELDIYIAQKKTEVLKKKIQDALELAPDNEVLHFVLANLYRGTKQFAEAEKEYLKALELRPDYEPANYNLGVLYYSQGKEWNEKLNDLPPRDPKTKEYEQKTNEYFKKAVSYFETSYEVTKDKQTKQVLRQLTLRLGDTEKAEKYK